MIGDDAVDDDGAGSDPYGERRSARAETPCTSVQKDPRHAEYARSISASQPSPGLSMASDNEQIRVEELECKFDFQSTDCMVYKDQGSSLKSSN